MFTADLTPAPPVGFNVTFMCQEGQVCNKKYLAVWLYAVKLAEADGIFYVDFVEILIIMFSLVSFSSFLCSIGFQS